MRRLVQENHIHVSDLIYPVFIIDGHNRQEPIATLPGHYSFSLDKLLPIAAKCVELGIPGIAIFPAIESSLKTDKLAQEAYNPKGLVPRAITYLKQHYPDLGVFTDVALDAYTADGHDGISDEHGYVLNDLTNTLLIKQALCHAEAGADFICPSDMMDGRILAIRQALESANFINTGIIAHSAKYASSFYGPYREANMANVVPHKFGKQTYHMNPANSNEAIHEATLDLQEGADMIMVKPGLHYLDIIYRIKNTLHKPTVAFHVSGEYALLKYSAEWLNFDKAIIETMLCFKRAGADIIFTYAALEVAQLLHE